MEDYVPLCHATMQSGIDGGEEKELGSEQSSLQSLPVFLNSCSGTRAVA